MISMIRTRAFRVLAASLVAAVALTVSASDAKAMDAHVSIENHGCEPVAVFINGFCQAHARPHGHVCLSIHNCHQDCFTVTVRADCGHMLLSEHVHVHYYGQEFSFCVH